MMRRFSVIDRAPSRMRMACVPPEQIEPPHYVVDEWHRRHLVQAMRRDGWVERPLIVYRQPVPRRSRITRHAILDPLDITAPHVWTKYRVEARHAGKYRAITGSHRTAAARQAKLPCVPVLVLDKRAVAALVKCDAIDEHGNLQNVFPGYLADCLRSKKWTEQQRVAQLVELGGCRGLGATRGLP